MERAISVGKEMRICRSCYRIRSGFATRKMFWERFRRVVEVIGDGVGWGVAGGIRRRMIREETGFLNCGDLKPSPGSWGTTRDTDGEFPAFLSLLAAKASLLPEKEKSFSPRPRSKHVRGWGNGALQLPVTCPVLSCSNLWSWPESRKQQMNR